MRSTILAVLAATLIGLVTTSAEARPKHHRTTTAVIHNMQAQPCFLFYPCNEPQVNVRIDRRSRSHTRVTSSRDATIIGGRPAGCPYKYCGCGVSLKVWGKIIPKFNLARNWGTLPSAPRIAGMVAWRHDHVLYVEAHISGDVYRVYDPNTRGGKIRIHERNLRSFRFVNPHSRNYAEAN